MKKNSLLAFSLGLFVLGFSGVLMGSGYLVNRRVRKEGESRAYYNAMAERERKTGIASVIAGLAVMASAPAVYSVIEGVMDSFRRIEDQLNA